MKPTHSTSLISFLLFLSILSPTDPSPAATQSEADADSPSTIEERMNRITDALRERGEQLDPDQIPPEHTPLIAQFRNAFRNGGSGFRNGGFRNSGSGFLNRPGGGSFVNRAGGGGFINQPGWNNVFRNSPGFFNHRF